MSVLLCCSNFGSRPAGSSSHCLTWTISFTGDLHCPARAGAFHNRQSVDGAQAVSPRPIHIPPPVTDRKKQPNIAGETPIYSVRSPRSALEEHVSPSGRKRLSPKGSPLRSHISSPAAGWRSVVPRQAVIGRRVNAQAAVKNAVVLKKQRNRAHGFSARMRFTISIALWAHSAPLLPALVPARSIACSIVSVVRTPNITGTSLFSAALATPFATSLHT